MSRVRASRRSPSASVLTKAQGPAAEVADERVETFIASVAIITPPNFAGPFPQQEIRIPMAVLEKRLKPHEMAALRCMERLRAYTWHEGLMVSIWTGVRCVAPTDFDKTAGLLAKGTLMLSVLVRAGDRQAGVIRRWYDFELPKLEAQLPAGQLEKLRSLQTLQVSDERQGVLVSVYVKARATSAFGEG
jgi:hypothetical protein